MFFTKTKRELSYTLSVSLKSSSVDIQLVKNTDPKEVLFVDRSIIFLENSSDSELYTRECISSLSSLLKKNSSEIQKITAGFNINTKIILYSPWFTSHITQISYKDKVVVNEKFLTEQLKTIPSQKGLIVLEKKVIKILTNGYSITELSKSKFDNIFLEVYSSYLSEDIHIKIKTTIAESLPIVGKAFAFITSPVLFFNQIKSLLIHEDNVTFIYVGGEITEIGVIEDDCLSYYSTFPIGKHDFLREVQLETKNYNYDLLYQKEILIKQTDHQKNFDDLKNTWSNSVISSLYTHKKNIPSKILIISDSKTKDFFTTLLIEQIKTNTDGFLTHHRIINFDISLLKDIILYNTPVYGNELELQLEALI